MIGLVLIVAVTTGLIGFWLGRRISAVDRTRLVIEASASASGRTVSTGESRRQQDIERALADLRIGVVVVGEDGAETYRNHRARRFATGRHGDALVQAALRRVIDGALVGLSLEENVEVYGPPARSILVQASPTYDDGRLGGAVGVIDDVTEAHRIDRVRSDFVANVSHELRTPVGAMSVLAETIADSDDAEVVHRLAERMQREATRLGNTIDDLLALSRLESGPAPEPETIDLASVVSIAMERTIEASKQRGIPVVVRNDAGGPLLIEGDAAELVSAMANLLDNGIKYSDPPHAVVVGLERSGPAAEISVTDSGIGIPDRDLDRIFERFYRVDSARSRETGGTGLGLSIVRHALINHGGTIGVSSREGEGSTFVIRLPLAGVDDGLDSDGSEGPLTWTN